MIATIAFSLGNCPVVAADSDLAEVPERRSRTGPFESTAAARASGTASRIIAEEHGIRLHERLGMESTEPGQGYLRHSNVTVASRRLELRRPRNLWSSRIVMLRDNSSAYRSKDLVLGARVQPRQD